MASKSSVRFTLMTGGRNRKLFSIGQSRNGDVYLIPKTGGTYRDPGIALETQGGPHHGADILEVKYSIHPSPQSVEGVNVIKQTFTLSTGRPDVPRLYTKAIKARTGFVAIFFWRPSSMENPNRDLDEARRTILLDSFDPENFTPIIGFFVGHSSLTFDLGARDFKILTYVVGEYRFVFLLSYIWFTHTGAGFTINTASVDPKIFAEDDVVREALELSMYGYDVAACAELYRHARRQLTDEAISTAGETIGPAFLTHHRVSSLGFFKRGHEHTSEFIKRWRKVLGR